MSLTAMQSSKQCEMLPETHLDYNYDFQQNFVLQLRSGPVTNNKFHDFTLLRCGHRKNQHPKIQALYRNSEFCRLLSRRPSFIWYMIGMPVIKGGERKCDKRQ
jgi:hypothetical protein